MIGYEMWLMKGICDYRYRKKLVIFFDSSFK